MLTNEQIRKRVLAEKKLYKTNCKANNKPYHEEDFTQSIGMTPETLKKFGKSEGYPKLETLIPLVEGLGYDWNTFLTVPYEKQTARTQQTADVHRVTGLSEEAITTLKSAIEENITFFDTLIVESERLCHLVRGLASIYRFQELYADNLSNPKLRRVYNDVADHVNVSGSMSTPYDIQLAKELFVTMVQNKGLLEAYENPEHIFDLFYEQQSLPFIEYQIQQEVKRIIDLTISKKKEKRNEQTRD